jgi:hypothetical protein
MANNSEWVHVFALVQGPDFVEGAPFIHCGAWP